MKKQAWSRRLLLGCAAAIMLLTAGDSALTQVVTDDIGIDPLEILNLMVSPNVAIVVDTSGSMGAPFNATDGGHNNPALGADDFSSKMYQAKKALKTVISANAGKVNFGLLSYAVRNAGKDIDNQESNYTLNDGDRYVRYVTDQTNAVFWTGGRNKTGIDTTTDFFGTTVTENTGTSVSNVFNSFGAFGAVLDMGTSGNNCTDLAACRWFLSSAFVRSNVRYTWTNSTTMTASTIDCSAEANRAPLRLFPDDPHTQNAAKTDYARPCVQMVNNTGAATTFWYTSVAWTNPTSQCTGAALISAVPACMENDPDTVLGGLKLQLPLDGSCRNGGGTTTPVGAPCGITPTGANVAATDISDTNPAQDPNTMEGLLAGGFTPIAASLQWINTNRATVFANQVPGQSNYVILVTDGTESCPVGNPSSEATQVAAAAALYSNNITLFVVAMGMDAESLEEIAAAGSGGQYGPFSAQSPEDLVDALSNVVNQTATGDFSAQPSISASVFEWVGLVDLDPYDENERWRMVVPLTVQSTFEMPGFVGHVKAFVGDEAGNPTEVWDAGDKLCTQITGYGATTATPAQCNVTGAHATAMGNGSFAFADLTAGRLKRRIFTTSGNGVFTGTAQQPVPIWPPTTTSPGGVDPGYDNPTKLYAAGQFDVPLGIFSLDLATLQSTFGACRGTGAHSHCASPSSAATILSRARKEAREMILAYAAGAEVVRDGSNLPTRDASGEILYKARLWMLAEGTHSSSVVVTQPLPVGPGSFHKDEYNAYMNSYRFTPYPRMSVVYYGANDMLHAFRAGPAGTEGGGEELWGFVPYDQLSKLPLLLLEGQDRVHHKFMIASALRSADVFVPTPDSTTGSWRTYLFFGRGHGGKYYTALDVTAPGSFTTAALSTAPPLAVWSRGNPDTQDGTAGGPRNYLTNTDEEDLGVSDFDAYLTMGKTWSTPALGRIEAYDLEFMLYAGSGYGTAPGEGQSFYGINPLTGDIVTRADVGSSPDGTIPNAIVADVAVFNFGQLVADRKTHHPADSASTQVYVGDLHGRLWKFLTSASGTPILLWDFGVEQPIANAVALHNIDVSGEMTGPQLRPHIYVETGNERRVGVPGDGFVLYGLQDNLADPLLPLATELFHFELPERYRGTAQPATFVYEEGGHQAGRVAFSATRYNPMTAAECRSSFDSRIYLVSAQLGHAAFDINGDDTIDDTDAFYELEDEKVIGTRVSHGALVVDKGISPPPDSVPPPSPPENTTSLLFSSNTNPVGSPVCRMEAEP